MAVCTVVHCLVKQYIIVIERHSNSKECTYVIRCFGKFAKSANFHLYFNN